MRNLACSLLYTIPSDELRNDNAEWTSGRIVTTLAKAKELRGYVERLVTLAKDAQSHIAAAAEVGCKFPRGSEGWNAWRKSDEWRRWANAVRPAVSARRRAFAKLRSASAVKVLFEKVAPQFSQRNGGYTRVVRLASRRLGDGGQNAIFEFVFSRGRS